MVTIAKEQARATEQARRIEKFPALPDPLLPVVCLLMDAQKELIFNRPASALSGISAALDHIASIQDKIGGPADV